MGRFVNQRFSLTTQHDSRCSDFASNGALVAVLNLQMRVVGHIEASSPNYFLSN